MAEILKKSIFIHIPKTGGTWVESVLKHLNLTQGRPHNGKPHWTISHIRETSPWFNDREQVFTFVRNPVTWYQSRWTSPGHRYKRWEHTVMGHHDRDELQDFNLWLKRCWNRGGRQYVTQTYVKHLGPNYDLIPHVGKYETIHADLPRLLTACGETFDPNRIAEVRAANVSNATLDRRYTPENLQTVLRMERAAILKFGYSDQIRDYEHLVK